MGSFVHPNIKLLVHPTGAEHLTSLGSIREDAKVARDAANPSTDQVQEQELPLHSEMTPQKKLLSQCAAEEGSVQSHRLPRPVG